MDEPFSAEWSPLALPSNETDTAARLSALAARYVWWQPVETTRRDPRTLLWAIMRLGTAEDYVAARTIFGEAAFVAALQSADPGALDERSWLFWRRHFRLPEAPRPQRRFG